MVAAGPATLSRSSATLKDECDHGKPTTEGEHKSCEFLLCRIYTLNQAYS